MGELAAAIAHEINQPLCAIASNAQAAQRLLAGDTADLNEVRETLQDITADSRRASEVIGRIRGLFQKHDPERLPLDLNEAIREVLALLKSQLTRKSITVSLDLAASLPPVLGDRVQLQQVVLNLALNAIEAMSRGEPEQRELSVRSARDGEGAFIVSVRDSGPGIAAEQIEQVFDAFFTTKPGGVGIGLAISRSIIEAHGGRIWAEAAAGRGAAFHFTLPTPKETPP
jgi:signal transduction histidine kinase